MSDELARNYSWSNSLVKLNSRATGIFTAQARQPIQLRFDGGQLIAQCKRKESFCRTVRSIVRADLTSAAQQTIFVARLGAEITQALAEMGNTHWGKRGESRSESGNNDMERGNLLCAEVVSLPSN